MEINASGRNSNNEEINTRFDKPNLADNSSASVGPVIAPRLAPAEMNANKRVACVLVNTSAMKLQNTENWNRLNTLTQT